MYERCASDLTCSLDIDGPVQIIRVASIGMRPLSLISSVIVPANLQKVKDWVEKSGRLGSIEKAENSGRMIAFIKTCVL